MCTDEYNEALCWASENGCESVAKLLIANGADINAFENRPLYLAVKEKDRSMVEVLLDSGAVVGGAAVEAAVREGDLYCLEMLLSSDKTIAPYHSAIEAAARYYRMVALEMLLEGGWGSVSEEALLEAVSNGYGDMVRILLSYKALPSGNALLLASKNGYTYIVEQLLYIGTDIHFRNDEALRMAALHGHEDVVKVLLNNGADRSAGKYCALQWAITSGYTAIVNLLRDGN